MAVVLVLVTFGLTLNACRLSLRRLAPAFEARTKAPAVRPSARVALRPEEIDFEDDEELADEADVEDDADDAESAEPLEPRFRRSRPLWR